MKYNILFIISFLCSPFTYSQHYELLGYDMKSHLSNFSELNGFNMIDSNEKLLKFAYVFEGDTNMFLMCKFTNTEFGDECTEILYEFFCNECAEGNISSISNKKGEWVETDSNYYISKKRVGFDISLAKERESIVKTMHVTNSPDQKIKTTVLFRQETMKTKMWKKLIK